MIVDFKTILVIFGPIALLMPILAGAALKRFDDSLAKGWYAACFMLSCSYVLLILRPVIGSFLSFDLAQLIEVSSLGGMLVVLRGILGKKTKRQGLFAALLVGNLVVYEGILHFGTGDGVVLYNHAIFIVLDVLTLANTWRIHRQYESRGALLMGFGLVVAMAAYSVRVWAVLSGLGSEGFRAPGWEVSIEIICSLTDLWCRNLGFFGFMLEKANLDKSSAERKTLQARSDLQDSLQREAEMEELVKERDEMLRMLSHESRVSTIETLSSNLSHEINQPLATMLLNAETARWMLAQDPLDRVELAETLDAVIAENKRAAMIVQRMRSLVKNQAITQQPFQLLPVVETVVEIMSPDFEKHGVQCIYDAAAFQPWVFGDPLLLSDVLLNLMKNASEALVDSPHRHKCIELSCEAHADQVIVEVADNGVGMSQETAQQIFDPFFTTKSQGLGLGLAISKSIMKRMSGDLCLLQPATGTRFGVSLRKWTEGAAATDKLEQVLR